MKSKSKWLGDAVFYQIYPQSFRDTNRDGIGDLNGIAEKLDYIKDLGCNALWINPCFDSPFKDAGYDVRDYKRVAARYGTNNDLYRLFDEAHRRGIKVLLDLVAGHTSEEHPWFLASQRQERNEYTDRYIWTKSFLQGAAGMPYVAGESERSGCYALNFFKCQPALNYGFLRPQADWQLSVDHPDCVATREAMKDVMRFWLDHGCDGFRVDMAASLVRNDDENRTGIRKIWHEVRAMLDSEYPDAVLISEWGDPVQAIAAGFDADFYLHFDGNGIGSLLRDYLIRGDGKPNGEDHSFFKKDGKGDITKFLGEYLPWYEQTKGEGYIALQTGTHDTLRLRNSLGFDELKLAYAFLFTMPGVPFLYYGDEIGMRYLPLPTKEGGYERTGSRTPMQWGGGRNLGFSEGCEDSLYLPTDPAPDAPTVAAQTDDPHSLLNTVRAILRLRREEAALRENGNFEVVYAESGKFPFVYRRGELTLAVNPSEEDVSLAVEVGGGTAVFSIGESSLADGVLRMGAQSFVVFRK